MQYIDFALTTEELELILKMLDLNIDSCKNAIKDNPPYVDEIRLILKTCRSARRKLNPSNLRVTLD